MTEVPRRESLAHPMTERADLRPAGPWWWRTRATTATLRPVWLCCPRGHIGGMDDHEVAADGTVTPSVQCPEPDCDWHVNVRLAGWSP